MRNMGATELYLGILLFCTFAAFVKKVNVLGLVLFFIYDIIAFVAVYSIKQGIIDSDGITIIPYLFLCLTYLLFFSPFFKRKNQCTAKKIAFKTDIKIKIIAIIYIICAVIAILCYLPNVIQLINSGDWAMNRYNLYQDVSAVPYSNRIQFLSMQIAGYLRTLALIIGFTLLRSIKNRKYDLKDKKYDKILGYCTLGAAICYTIISAMYTSARGTIFNVCFFVMALYLFYYSEIEENRRRFISIVAILSLIAIIPYFMQVTVSRFTGNQAGNSILLYFSQPPTVFNKHIFKLPKYAWGNFGIGSLFGTNFTEASVGGNWKTGFYTFVGWLFIDWGPIGVLVIGLMICLIINKIIKKREYQIADIFFIMSYYQILTSGVFVIGRTYIYTLIGNLVIYLFLKSFVENKTYIFGKIKF